MDRNNNYEQQYNEILDVVLKNALIRNANDYFGNIPSEEEIGRSHTFSTNFQENMAKLLADSREHNQSENNQQKLETELFPSDNEKLDQSFWEEWKHNANRQGSENPSAQQQTVVQNQGTLPEQPTPAVQGSATSIQPLTQIQQPSEAALNTVASGDSAVQPQQSKTFKCHQRMKVAAAAAVAVLIVGIGFLGSSTTRASFKQTFLNFEGQGVLITNTSPDDIHILFREPTHIPHEYKVSYHYEGDTFKQLQYSNGIAELQIFYTLFSGDADASFDNERHVIDSESILLKQKYEAYYFPAEKQGDANILYWQNGTIQYQINSVEPMDSLIKIAESMMQ